jgi:hypothetical protein
LAGLGGVLIDARYAFAAASHRPPLLGGRVSPVPMLAIGDDGMTVDATVEVCVVHIVTADR